MKRNSINDKIPLAENHGAKASVCLFSNAYSKTATLRVWTPVYDMIRNDKDLYQICAQLRDIVSQHGKDSDYAAAKKQLPAIAPAAIMEGGRGYKYITALTGCTMVDIDDIDDPDRLQEVVRVVDACPYTMLRHITPSGMGVRVIVQYDVPAKEVNYFNVWQQVNEFYSTLTGCPVDIATKDPSRLSFLAHDKTAFFNPDSKLFLCVERTEIWTGNDDENPFAVAETITRKRHSFVKGDRHNYLVYLAFLLCKMGVAEGEAAAYLEQAYGIAYPDEHMCALAASVYKNSADAFGSWTDRKVRYNPHMQSYPDKPAKPSKPSTASQPAKDKKEKKSGYASVDDILRWMKDNGYIGCSKAEDNKLRYNEITNVVEIWNSEVQKFVPISDRDRSSLWVAMSQSLQLRVRQQDLDDLVLSDAVPRFNPCQAYVDSLPEWDGTDYIGQLAATVVVAGDRDYFSQVFKKWFVAILPGMLCDDTVNETVLVFIGKQGIFKSTFFERLLPPPLQDYYLSKTNSQRMTKDDRIMLSQNILINFEEIDSLSPKDLSQIKAVITAKSVTERGAYRHNADRFKHIASFCATGNNMEFLTDMTGNRRWLTFEVLNIASPREHPFNHTGLYSQALHLWKNGFQYWFDGEEISKLEVHQQDFRAPSYEEELIQEIFRKPRTVMRAADGEKAVPTLEIGTIVSTAYIAARCCAKLHMQISDTKFAQAMRSLGFQQTRKNNARYWLVVERTPEELESEKICETL